MWWNARHVSTQLEARQGGVIARVGVSFHPDVRSYLAPLEQYLERNEPEYVASEIVERPGFMLGAYEVAYSFQLSAGVVLDTPDAIEEYGKRQCVAIGEILASMAPLGT